MTVTRTAAGAVALLLYGARTGHEADDRLAEAILDLRAVVGSDVRQMVDRWIAEGGPDGEQVYCLDHLLQSRLSVEPQLCAAVEAIVARGHVAPDALRALAEHAICNGFRGAYDWCLAALAVPFGRSQVEPTR